MALSNNRKAVWPSSLGLLPSPVHQFHQYKNYSFTRTRLTMKSNNFAARKKWAQFGTWIKNWQFCQLKMVSLIINKLSNPQLWHSSLGKQQTSQKFNRKNLKMKGWDEFSIYHGWLEKYAHKHRRPNKNPWKVKAKKDLKTSYSFECSPPIYTQLYQQRVEGIKVQGV